MTASTPGSFSSGLVSPANPPRWGCWLIIVIIPIICVMALLPFPLFTTEWWSQKRDDPKAQVLVCLIAQSSLPRVHCWHCIAPFWHFFLKSLFFHSISETKKLSVFTDNHTVIPPNGVLQYEAIFKKIDFHLKYLGLCLLAGVFFYLQVLLLKRSAMSCVMYVKQCSPRFD